MYPWLQDVHLQPLASCLRLHTRLPVTFRLWNICTFLRFFNKCTTGIEDADWCIHCDGPVAPPKDKSNRLMFWFPNTIKTYLRDKVDLFLTSEVFGIDIYTGSIKTDIKKTNAWKPMTAFIDKGSIIAFPLTLVEILHSTPTVLNV